MSALGVACLGGCSDPTTTTPDSSTQGDAPATSDAIATDDHDDGSSVDSTAEGGDASAPDAVLDVVPDISIPDARVDPDVRARDRLTDVPPIDAAACACPVREAGEFEPVHFPVQCFCNDSGCPYIEDYDIARTCRDTVSSEKFLRISGCGKIMYQWLASFPGGWRRTFDAETGQLIGAAASNDYPAPPCTSFSHIYGEDFDGKCADAVTCDLCGSDGGVPMCP